MLVYIPDYNWVSLIYNVHQPLGPLFNSSLDHLLFSFFFWGGGGALVNTDATTQVLMTPRSSRGLSQARICTRGAYFRIGLYDF